MTELIKRINNDPEFHDFATRLLHHPEMREQLIALLSPSDDG